MITTNNNNDLSHARRQTRELVQQYVALTPSSRVMGCWCAAGSTGTRAPAGATRASRAVAAAWYRPPRLRTIVRSDMLLAARVSRHACTLTLHLADYAADAARCLQQQVRHIRRALTRISIPPVAPGCATRIYRRADAVARRPLAARCEQPTRSIAVTGSRQSRVEPRTGRRTRSQHTHKRRDES